MPFTSISESILEPTTLGVIARIIGDLGVVKKIDLIC
jgi:hypothetical protein